MNKLQELIMEIKLRRSSHQKKRYKKGITSDVMAISFGRMSECDFFIHKLTLLLNAEAETNGEKDCKNDGNAV